MDSEEQFEKLKAVLDKHTSWPTVYMFKFIIPADNHRIALLDARQRADLDHGRTGGQVFGDLRGDLTVGGLD